LPTTLDLDDGAHADQIVTYIQQLIKVVWERYADEEWP
jgi:hypothetical protein